MKIIYPLIFIFILAALIYLSWPASGFPPPPPGSVESFEPADTESVYRKSFYTQLTRSQIMAYYRQQFHFPLQFRLDRPPEEAYTLIRDQTKSSWLEQLVHPWRDTLFINGFYPTLPNEQIYIGKVHYVAKITLHYYPSHPATRLTVLILAVAGSWLLYREYRHV